MTDESIAEPADVAIKQNYWTIQIRKMDSLLDGLRREGDQLAQSNATVYARKVREATQLVEEVRDSMLALNYDANRKGNRART